MKPSLILTVFLWISLVGCDSASRAPKFITSTGKSELFRKQMTVDVFETPDGRINYSVMRRRKKIWHNEAQFDKNRPWLIYPATVDEVWAFDGDKKVVLIEFLEKTTKFSDLASVPGLLQHAPAEFLNRLPENLKPK